jgi:Tfp pilus assembly protein PilV
LKHNNVIEAKSASPNDSLFASTRRKLRQNTSIMSPRNRKSKIENHKSRFGVTVVEVLFAMFVILFGLVGLAAIIPMAARQANDSYAMVHGAASMDNIVQELRGRGTIEPTQQQPWWMPNDYTADPFLASAGNYSNALASEALSFSDLRSVFTEFQARKLLVDTGVTWPNAGSATRDQQIRALREGLAQGFCIDPVFCATQFRDSWNYSTAYTNDRGSATQGFMRRTRTPFFDETVGLISSGPNSARYAVPPDVPVFNFPRLVRVSYQSGTNAAGAPLPVKKAMADMVGMSGTDVLQAIADDDKSAGALRGFQTSGGALLSSNSDVGSVSWMITMTPTENTPPGVVPTTFNVSTVIFNGRDRVFDAVPFSVSGAEEYSRSEKLCFATADSANNIGSNVPVYTALADLPGSDGGSMNIKLYSDAATNPSVRVGDWIMLSRRIELGNLVNTASPPALIFPNDFKVIHRHRWYRVTGTDNGETWPRVVRVTGEPWDYPETFAANRPKVNFPVSAAQATNATIFRNVVAVYSTISNIASE